MTTTQLEMLAYGHPVAGGHCGGGIVLGGANADRFTLLSWDWDVGATTIQIRGTIWVHDAGAADRATNFDLLQKALAAQDGNVCIATGVDRTITATSAVTGQLITITRASGSTFVTGGPGDDTGTPIIVTNANGDKRSYMISRVLSSDVAECIVPPGETPLSFLSVNVTVEIPHVLYRSQDQTGDGTVYKYIGFGARTSLDRRDDPDDDAARRTYDFSISLERPAQSSRAGIYFRAAQITRSVSAAGLAAVEFSGTVTAGFISGDTEGREARSMLATAIDSWITAQLSALFPSLTMEVVLNQPDSWDDRGNVLQFKRSYRELNFPDLATAANDSRISGARVSMGRVYRNSHGLRGGRPPPIISVTYSASINKSQTYDQLVDFWRTSIKPHLVAEALANFGGPLIISGGSDPVVDFTASEISGSFTAMVIRANSVLAYKRRTRMSLLTREEFDDLLDGRDHSYAIWDGRGRALTGSVSVVVQKAGDPTALMQPGREFLRFGEGAGGGLFFAGGKLALSIKPEHFGIFGIGAKSGVGDLTEPAGYVVFPTPGDPVRLLGTSGEKIAPGTWRALSWSADEGEEFMGQDPDNLGATIRVYDTVYSGSFVWVAGAVAEKTPDSGDGSKYGPKEATGVVSQRPSQASVVGF